ncbi:iron-containing alcohol dehydrogenase [Rhizobium sp. CRIBSB]|nr:iron-containing alcohol dehydrogenase [Rhizobium sp. CRIBSB]
MRIFASTPFYLQGPGALGRVGEITGRHGTRPAIIIDALVRPLVGQTLEDGFVGSVDIRPFAGEVTEAAVVALADTVGGCDVVVAVGGGKALDAGKAVALRRGLPVICVPTIASTDGPASRGIALYDDHHRLVRVEQLPANPVAVIVDTAVIAGAPVRFLRAGIGDAVAKMFEAEGCWAGGGLTKHGTRPTHSARAIATAAYGLLRAHAVAAVAAVEHHQLTEDLEATVEATVLLSAMGFENGGLSIAHSTTRGLMTLRGARDRLHGEHVAYGTLVQIAVEDGPDQGIHGDRLADVARFLHAVGLPTCLVDLGVDDVTRDELQTMAGAIMASPHIGNVARPVTQAHLLAALTTLEARAAAGWVS